MNSRNKKKKKKERKRKVLINIQNITFVSYDVSFKTK